MSVLSPEDWQRLEPYFDQLLDLAANQRQACLTDFRDLSAEDRDHLRELLKTHDSDDLKLNQPLLEDAAELVAASIIDSLIGEQLGPYEVGAEIGRGGMGVVYRGQRVDGKFDQDVVIKVLRLGVDTADMQRRFLQERQILADLNHPSIARLLDGGFTADGRPYLVMNFIDGLRIDDYCDQNKLTLKARVRLFLSVIEAVGHAHLHLVIHRDLKPSNVWVDHGGKVHLLDFGIAKITDQNRDADITSTMQQVMTPEYASPEQFLRKNITTASDIYQLGGLLYQLLTGQQPFDLSGKSAAQMEKKVCQTDPALPSRAVTASDESFGANVSPRQLEKLLRGDMDLILQKALRKEPERRYSSAHEFRQDLINWLTGDRILARPDSLRYQTIRLVRRNPLAVTLVATVVVCAVGFTFFHLERITTERDVARLEAERHREVSDFLVNLLKVPDPTASEGREITARELLEDSFPRINDELSDPQTKVRLLKVVGEVAVNLGLYDQAGPALYDVVKYTAEIYGERSLEVAAAKLQLAEMYRLAQMLDDALAPAEDALAIRREGLPADDVEIGKALKVVALIHRNLRNYELAETELREAKTIIDAQLPDSHILHISVVADLAYVLRTVGQVAEAEELYRQTIDQMRLRESEFRLELPSALNNLGYLLRKKEAFAEAEALYREAIVRSERHNGQYHPTTLMFRNNLSGVLLAQDKQSEVVAELKTIIVLQEHLTGHEHWRTAVAHRSLGYFNFTIGEFQDAIEELRIAEQIFEQVLEPNHLWTARATLQLAICLDLTGDSEEGERIWREVRPVLATNTSREDRGVQGLLKRLQTHLPAAAEPWPERLSSLATDVSGQ